MFFVDSLPSSLHTCLNYICQQPLPCSSRTLFLHHSTLVLITSVNSLYHVLHGLSSFITLFHTCLNYICQQPLPCSSRTLFLHHSTLVLITSQQSLPCSSRTLFLITPHVLITSVNSLYHVLHGLSSFITPHLS